MIPRFHDEYLVYLSEITHEYDEDELVPAFGHWMRQRREWFVAEFEQAQTPERRSAMHHLITQWDATMILAKERYLAEYERKFAAYVAA